MFYGIVYCIDLLMVAGGHDCLSFDDIEQQLPQLLGGSIDFIVLHCYNLFRDILHCIYNLVLPPKYPSWALLALSG